MACRSDKCSIKCAGELTVECRRHCRFAEHRHIRLRRSTVPLVILNTLGNAITNFQKTPAWVTIIDTANGRSSIHGVVEYDGHAGVSIRGNSSRAHPKKAFRLELQDAAGNDFKTPLLGMPKESDWILFPAYTDKTLIRDALAYELWREMGHYAPRTRFVELFIVTNAMERPHPLPREREQVASGTNGSGQCK